MNIELFIALVKERPVLYDVRNPLYKDKREKNKKWREICTAMDITSEYLLTRSRYRAQVHIGTARQWVCAGARIFYK